MTDCKTLTTHRLPWAMLFFIPLLAAVFILSGCPGEPEEPPAAIQQPEPETEPVEPVSAEGEEVNTPAPAFKVTDINNIDRDLGSYSGRILVIDFWATYCKPCIKKLSEYEALYQSYRNHNVEFLGLSMDQSDDIIRGWLESNDINFPLARCNDETREAFFGDAMLVAIPQTRIIDGKGILRYSFGSEATSEQVEEAIVTLLKEKGSR